MSGPRSSGSGDSISGGWRLSRGGRSRSGRCGGVPLIGLPGNPVAAALTFAILARPLILRLAGAAMAPPLTFPVQAGFTYRKKAGRREYLRASIERDGESAIARRFPRDGAGILSSIVQSRGVCRPRRGRNRAGPRQNGRIPALLRGVRMTSTDPGRPVRPDAGQRPAIQQGIRLLYFAWLRTRDRPRRGKFAEAR